MREKRTIIISNRLPIRIERRDQKLHFLPSEGGLATGLGSVYKQKDNIWIGWPGFTPDSQEEEDIIREKLAEENLVPIFLSDEEIQGYYEGFSNEVLWPVFHYRLSYAVYNIDNWHSYQQVNQKFASRLEEQNISERDEIWIHDYQLMLLPNLVRKNHEQIAIGYFQHIPFPPDEVFRGIPWRDELLRGLLGADLIAFHTYNDTQHFLNSCTHILGESINNNSLDINGRNVSVEAYPMGIDFQKFDSLANSPEIRIRAKEIRDYYKDKTLILSIDRLDYSKGIIERLKAYESLLMSYPQFQEQVILYMLVVPSRDTVAQYKLLRDEIDRMVGHINAVYGSNEWIPIAYFYNSFPVEELSALYVSADICLVTSTRDGMNLVCKEYVASKVETNGVLVLSELAGAAKYLLEAIQVNPNSIEQIRDGLKQAIEMSDEEKRDRMDENIEIVKKFNIRHWVKIFFTRLRETKIQQKHEMDRRVRPVVRNAMLARYRESKRRLFFLDYDGTLVGFEKDAHRANPTEILYNILIRLQHDPANQIVIISGRKQATLQNWFNNMGLFLVAEHGAWTNYPNFKWTSKTNLSTQWKIPVKRIMDKYANRTAGASVEEKSYSLAWHYRKAQAGLGLQRAQELYGSLQYLLKQHGLQILFGDKVIEVKSSALNKGTAAMEIVTPFKPDFIFVIGDDATDEDMFVALPEYTISVKVGNKKTDAQFYVETQKDAIALIEFFASNGQDEKATNVTFLEQLKNQENDVQSE
ncbi:bifunctional alpha,alpha-trehalose-phosphate synthase (UDP-forming)/trehalose-phosphatase [Sphingobacterium shayense]|uniref:bifunctional alpha,alpha-trehalose-phosphate synthase (UDP-forming)/trehalose-phosphatase n=1 Tax=Sphingobacterium shayense TaxID=626343 RepID=UPI001552AD6F|nr:bifunctional alpha,alpha-trehalose-phosphate synthase (UDP-forming)/trehalose-phosphatase [Sphingobacterium shayense]NQD69879.1 bifunctional alpha,alpha-trehalose-phosphate synthase (UDP-forming)/trehalose-phosphatase [Sphingobacterium shayense]